MEKEKQAFGGAFSTLFSKDDKKAPYSNAFK
jgi:hypothetical protein